MKVLIYMPFSAWIPHLATDLEIAVKHIKSGDEVHIIQCSGDLPSCEPNPNHFKLSGILLYIKYNFLLFETRIYTDLRGLIL